MGRFGLFGAKARSARVTEAPVAGNDNTQGLLAVLCSIQYYYLLRIVFVLCIVIPCPVGGVRVREGGGACRSRVRDGAARAVWGGTSGRRSVGRPGDRVEIAISGDVVLHVLYSGQPTFRALSNFPQSTLSGCIPVDRPFELCRISPKVHYPDGVCSHSLSRDLPIPVLGSHQ